MLADFWAYLLAPYQSYASIDIALEATAVALGLLSVWFSKQANIWVYPTGIISTAIYVYLLFKAGLYGDMSINAYYVSMSIYGWIHWSRPGPQAEPLPIGRATRTENWIGLGILGASFALLAYVLEVHTPSTVPYLDAFTTAIFFVGMWFMAKKKLEHWIYWIVGDAITVPLYVYKGLGLTAIQYVIFTGLAVWGLVSWWREWKGRSPTASPGEAPA